MINSSRRQSQLNSMSPATPVVISSVQELYEFACSGPLVEKLGLTPKIIAETFHRWLNCGLYLCRLFQFNELNLSIPQKARFYHFYIPVFFWCEDQIFHHRSMFKDAEDIPPLVIGFAAPQGSGKTTLVSALDYLLRCTGRKSATISIDDFYLTAEDQAELREENPGNALLELRGNAGSHDLQLSVETLMGLCRLTNIYCMRMKLPRYNKSAFGGRGDRADPSTWPEVEGPLAAILFEGWMLGFKPLEMEVVKAIDPQLVVVNKNLEAYYDAWDKFVASWMVIKVKDPNCVYEWRLQVIDFISRFLSAYKAYLPTLYSEGPNGSDIEHLLVVEIDENRNLILHS
uniref:D-glycerate 3-kinase, chloroplastic n=1 Tax=Nelumbo nucifera TaxID=4432 RepID=A0A822Y4W4_NELNU|nr:TPA_asm: hypothetical protein HUJ06_028119 [Nelumbo nucifera]